MQKIAFAGIAGIGLFFLGLHELKVRRTQKVLHREDEEMEVDAGDGRSTSR